MLSYSIVHLSALVLFGLFLVRDLARFLDGSWFLWLGQVSRHVAAGAAVVALTTGAVALVTIATSAALRFDASLQFLQLLSALDIAWVVAATLLGVRWLAGKGIGDLAGTMIGIVCVWSIWNYLQIVGFAEDGGWLVDGSAMLRYVIPYDIVAAVVATTALTTGARRAGRAQTVTEP
ncbi:MAG: hypothetical protein WD354_10590 [Acidimicrobiia bacterium]